MWVVSRQFEAANYDSHVAMNTFDQNFTLHWVFQLFFVSLFV